MCVRGLGDWGGTRGMSAGASVGGVGITAEGPKGGKGIVACTGPGGVEGQATEELRGGEGMVDHGLEAAAAAPVGSGAPAVAGLSGSCTTQHPAGVATDKVNPQMKHVSRGHASEQVRRSGGSGGHASKHVQHSWKGWCVCFAD